LLNNRFSSKKFYLPLANSAEEESQNRINISGINAVNALVKKRIGIKIRV